MTFELINVTKVFKSRHRLVKALDGISLNLPEKGFICIVGESGSGKTTLLNILSLLDLPTSGKILFDGNDLSRCPEGETNAFRNSKIGIVFQNLNLLNQFSVYQNVVLPSSLCHQFMSRQQVSSLLESVGLDSSILDAKPKDLSGGQQQRVAIARAIAKNPTVLLADEPTGSLDAETGARIFELLKSQSSKCLVVVVTHNLAFAHRFADRIITLDHGCVEGDAIAKKEEEKRLEPHQKMLLAKPSSLSLFHRGKIGLSLSIKNPVRTLLSLVSFSLALGCLMASGSLYSYDETSLTERAIESEGVSSFSLINATGWSNSDIEALDKACGEVFYPGYVSTTMKEAYDSSNYSLPDDTEKIDSNSTVFLSTLPVSPALAFGLRMTGRLPIGQSSDSLTEVMITNYLCYQRGWIDSSHYNDEASFENVINSRTLKAYSADGYSVNTVKIVGVIDTGYRWPTDSSYDMEGWGIEKTYGLHRCLFASETECSNIRAKDVSRGSNQSAGYDLLFGSPKDGGYLKVKKYISEGAKTSVSVEFRLSPSLTRAKLGEQQMNVYFLVASVILLLISILSFVSLVLQTISRETRTIAILRSLGSGFSDCFGIFFFQDLAVSLFSLALGSSAYAIFLPVINAEFRKSLFISIDLASYEWWAPLICFAGAVAISSFVTFVYLAKRYKKTAIIRN